MSQHGHILLVSCYELGHAPHGLVVPRAFLDRAGFASVCVDLSVQALTDEHVDGARMAVLSVPMHTAMRLGVRIGERIRERNPSCELVFTGLYAAMNREHLRDTFGRVHVLAGEYEGELVAIARGEPGGRAVALDKLPFPRLSRRDLPPLDHYARIERSDGREELAGYAETSRGCLDTCRHCPVPSVYGGRFFVIDRAVVLDDIAAQIDSGARHITFGDPDFLNGPGHAMEVVRQLHQRWPEVTFDVTAQIAHLLRYPDRVAELPGLGCAFVVSAVESLSDRVLSALAKQHRRADFERALALCDEVGLPMRPTFVPFTPWTTLGDIRELVDLIAERGLVRHVSPVQLSIRLLVPPGSLLLSAHDVFGPLDPARLSHTWTHPDAAVDALQRDIAAAVEHGAEAGHDDAATFDRIRALVYDAAGDAPPQPLRDQHRPAPPRLTEPWFC